MPPMVAINGVAAVLEITECATWQRCLEDFFTGDREEEGHKDIVH